MTLIRCSAQGEHTLFLANFRLPEVRDGNEGSSHSVLSEALISLGDWKDRRLWPFLLLGLGIAQDIVGASVSLPRFSLALSPPSVLWKREHRAP